MFSLKKIKKNCSFLRKSTFFREITAFTQGPSVISTEKFLRKIDPSKNMFRDLKYLKNSKDFIFQDWQFEIKISGTFKICR